MALRNQPYIPLYVQDYLTDEKLNMCSASTQGVYIKIMCVMHKSDEYGKILLKQKEKQTGKQIKDFAYKLARLLPFTIDIIEPALIELIDENVLHVDGDSLCQKRMIKDEKISSLRSQAGSLGGKTTQFDKANNKANNKAKQEANSENEDETVNETAIKAITKRKEKILEYCKEQNYPINEGEAFFDHYQALGWLTNAGMAIVDWKAKMRTWHNKQIKNNGNGKQPHDTKMSPDLEQIHKIRLAKNGN
jgi:hypothetical protein